MTSPAFWILLAIAGFYATLSLFFVFRLIGGYLRSRVQDRQSVADVA